MNEDALDTVTKSIRDRAKGMQRVASVYFGFSIGLLGGVGYLFFKIGAFDSTNSTIDVALSLLSRIVLITFTFYMIRIMMSVVTYNLGVSNDLFAKADALVLYKNNGTVSLKELKEHLEINNHKFQASKGFSGKDELENLVKIIKVVESKTNKSSNTDGGKSATGS